MVFSFAGMLRHNRILALATAGFVLSGLSAAAVATADPTTDTTAAAATAPATQATAPPAGPSTGSPGGGAKTGTAANTLPFGHLPIIDIVPTFTQPYPVGTQAVFQNPLVNSGTGYQPIDIGGSFKLPILPWLSADIDRNIDGTLNVPNARVTTAANKEGQEKYTIPAFARDVVLVYRLDQNFKRFQIEEGLYFRHRAVGGANTSATPYLPTISSTEAHYGYIGFTYSTPGVPGLLHSFLTANINFDRQAVDHHIGCGPAKTVVSGNYTFDCFGGTYDPNPGKSQYYETDQYVQLTVPIDPKGGVAFVVQDRWGALNFYENAAFPYRWATSQSYVFSKRFNKILTISVRDKTQTSVIQGAPYVGPNAQHNGSLDVLADFKVDTNHL
jgi:hypothetical protein